MQTFERTFTNLTRGVRRTRTHASVKYMWYLRGVTRLGKVCAQPYLWELHGDMLQPANHHPRIEYEMQSRRPLLFRLFEDEELVKLLDMKHPGLQCRG